MRWGGIFDIDAKLIEISNEEEKTFAPNFWDNPKEAELLVKNLRSKKKWVEDYEKAVLLLETILEKYKEDLKGDDATFLLAELYDGALNNKNKAMELYKAIITDYSSSILVVQARKKYRVLRGDN